MTVGGSHIASAVRAPSRVLGLHFFFHPAKNQLVEVVPGAATNAAVFRRAWLLQEQLRNIPIASRDAYGFVVNRFFVTWLVESVRMLDHVSRLCKERNVGALLVEHDVDGVFRTCDVITVVDLGQVLVCGSPAEVRGDERVIRAYLGTAA